MSSNNGAGKRPPRKTYEHSEITSLTTAAPGWWAVYKVDGSDKEHYEPIAVWVALRSMEMDAATHRQAPNSMTMCSVVGSPMAGAPYWSADEADHAARYEFDPAREYLPWPEPEAAT